MLSTGLGRIVPNLISRKHTNSAATGMAYLNVTLLCTIDKGDPMFRDPSGWGSNQGNRWMAPIEALINILTTNTDDYLTFK